jgi:hemoglobin-like flavoprotein
VSSAMLAGMNPDSIHLVRSTFAQVRPIANTAATLFYERLFNLDPSLRQLFPDDLGPQKHALMAALGAAIERLDRPAELVPLVEQLGVRHAGYGVQAAHYATVGEALMWTLQRGLGPAFTAEARVAWLDVFQLLATTMQAAVARAAPARVG